MKFAVLETPLAVAEQAAALLAEVLLLLNLTCVLQSALSQAQVALH